MELAQNMANGNVNKAGDESEKVIEVREPDAFYPYLAFKTDYDKKQKVLKAKRRKKRMLRKKQMGSDYDENESGSYNEIVGDEFDEQMDVDSTEEVKQDD